MVNQFPTPKIVIPKEAPHLTVRPRQPLAPTEESTRTSRVVRLDGASPRIVTTIPRTRHPAVVAATSVAPARTVTTDGIQPLIFGWRKTTPERRQS